MVNRKMDLPVNEIICGDCLEVMKDWPDNCVDLVLTDPPYGVRKKEKWDEWVYFINNLQDWLDGCLYLSKTVIWFCAGKIMPYILRDREDILHRLLIWNKPKGSQFAGAMHDNIWYSIEPILVFGEPQPLNKGKRYGFAAFEYPTVAMKENGHPTTKPIGLMYDLVEFYSKPNDLILDPFCGSGTTCVAAKKLGRRYIGIDVSEKYCEIARMRLKAVDTNVPVAEQKKGQMALYE